jgi:hypothetical protein
MPVAGQSRQETKAERERHLADTGQMHAVMYLLRKLHMITLRSPVELTEAERDLLRAAREGRGGDVWWSLRAEGKIR